MSTEYSPYPAPQWAPPAPPKKKAWWKKPLVWVPAVALVCGLAIGTGMQPEPKTIEVTKEVPGPERIVTKEVEVEVAAPSCLEYVDLSEEGFTYAAEAMGYMGEAMSSAAKMDVAGIQSANADLERVNPKMKALSGPMNAAKAECRSAK